MLSQQIYDRILSPIEMVDNLLNITENEITELQVFISYLDSQKGKQTDIQNAQSLAQQRKKNERDIMENQIYLAYLRELRKMLDVNPKAIEEILKPKPMGTKEAAKKAKKLAKQEGKT